jgi:hypothetical protein
MGKPMKSRILSIVLALSLIAVLFAAIPTKAAITYTGTVMTTDHAGTAKTDFIQGEFVYVKVEVMNDGELSDQQITVSLVRTNDGHLASSFTTHSNDPVVGWYNSTQAAGELNLSTSHSITGDVQSYNVIVTLPGHGGIEIARSQIVVRAVGLDLTPTPNNPAYWPGEVITITLVVTLAQTSNVFYVQILNDTGAATDVNFTAQTATAGYWSHQFTIGATLPDGTYDVNVRAQSDHSVWYTDSFDVQAFEMMVDAQRDAYLPGETAKITYMVLDLSTLARITSGVTLYYNASYQNSTGNLTWQNGTLDLASTLWEFTLPTNGTSATSIALYSNVDIDFTATQSAGQRKVTDSLTLLVGSIAGSVDVDSANYVPGDTVVVTVDANVLGDSLDGAKVDVTVWKNGTEMIAAYGATNLTTNQDGSAMYVFKLAESADLGVFNYIVKATVTKVGYSITRETQFTVETNSNLVVALDQTYYYGGQEATASFEPILNNMPASVGTIGYMFMMNSLLLAMGNTTSMSATVTIPESSFGTLAVEAFTNINGELVGGGDSAPVYFALLGLTPEKSTYRPGDTVVFQWTVVTGQASADLAYEVSDANGVRVANGTPAFDKTGSFEFTVPDAGPLLSTSYDATLRMTTPEGGFASATATVTLVSQTELIISVGKSPYTSGEFAPGQKVTIHYDLSSYVMSARPTIRLHVMVSFDPITFDVVVDSPTGTISYTIPKDAPMAQHTVTVWAYDAANGDFLAADQTAFQVNNQASGWDSSIGGISAIDLVLLILLIIVIIMLIVVPYMKDRMARPKPPEDKPMELTPPSESGKSPPSP